MTHNLIGRVHKKKVNPISEIDRKTEYKRNTNFNSYTPHLMSTQPSQPAQTETPPVSTVESRAKEYKQWLAEQPAEAKAAKKKDWAKKELEEQIKFLENGRTQVWGFQSMDHVVKDKKIQDQLTQQLNHINEQLREYNARLAQVK
jgi:hypothetical protein